MKVTREVVVDLWPLCASGEASADSRRVVEEYLREDPELAAELRRAADAATEAPPAPALAPDHELVTLKRTRSALIYQNWPLFFAILFSCFAFGRIVSDTSWDVSPRNFAIIAGLASVFWVVFLVRTVRWLARLR